MTTESQKPSWVDAPPWATHLLKMDVPSGVLYQWAQNGDPSGPGFSQPEWAGTGTRFVVGVGTHEWQVAERRPLELGPPPTDTRFVQAQVTVDESGKATAAWKAVPDESQKLDAVAIEAAAYEIDTDRVFCDGFRHGARWAAEQLGAKVVHPPLRTSKHGPALEGNEPKESA
jgi:hypothetical protein